MDAKLVAMIKGWLAMHNGDVEGLARWMRGSLGIGIKAARAAIAEAVNAS